MAEPHESDVSSAPSSPFNTTEPLYADPRAHSTPPNTTSDFSLQSTPVAAGIFSGLQNTRASQTHKDHSMIKELELDGWFLPSAMVNNVYVPPKCPAVLYGGLSWDAAAKDVTLIAALQNAAICKEGAVETSRYKDIVYFLNVLSEYWALRARNRNGGARSTIVFTCAGRDNPPSDWLGLNVDPDLMSFEQGGNFTLEKLKEYCQDPDKSWSTFPIPPYYLSSSVLEIKRGQNVDMKQLKTYMSNLKRHRPDMETVYGMFVEERYVRIASMSASGLRTTDSACAVSMQPWLAFVSAVYYSHDHRDTRISLVKQVTSFACWNLQFIPDAILVPFHAGAAIGNSTFAGFLLPKNILVDDKDLEFFRMEALGFAKISRQRKDARWKEHDILVKIHANGNVPGVARLESAFRDDRTSLTPNPLGSPIGPERQLDIIHLGSIGEPLSQAISLRHWIFMAYDVLEAHLHLCELGVLQRDLSWANCLSFPRHPKTDKNDLIRPCIRKIVAAADVKLDDDTAELGRKKGTADEFEPCAMITDFDHAAEIGRHDKGKGKNDGCTDRTGTPMFISCELASSRAILKYNEEVFPWDQLEHALSDIERTDNGRRALRAAGLERDSAAFMSTFRKIVKDEKQRRRLASEESAPQPFPEHRLHQWRHDCDSVFWWLLWGTARAQPRDPSLYRLDDDKGNYYTFCQAMLGHVVGNNDRERARAIYLRHGHISEELFHPAFERIHPLLSNMAAYISIPWFLYADKSYKLKSNHAHVAFRRLLLAWAIRDDAKHSFLDIRLNTERPRFAEIGRQVLQQATSTRDRSNTVGSEPFLSKLPPESTDQTSASSPKEANTKKNGSKKKKPTPSVQANWKESLPTQKKAEPRPRPQMPKKKSRSPMPPPQPKNSISPAPPAAEVLHSPAQPTTSRSLEDSVPSTTRPRKRKASLTELPTKKHKSDKNGESDDIQGAEDQDPMVGVLSALTYDIPDKLKAAGFTRGCTIPRVVRDEVELKRKAEKEAAKLERKQREFVERKDERIDAYVESRHHDKRSVYALRLKFWKDAMYWFGSGE